MWYGVAYTVWTVFVWSVLCVYIYIYIHIYVYMLCVVYILSSIYIVYGMLCPILCVVCVLYCMY